MAQQGSCKANEMCDFGSRCRTALCSGTVICGFNVAQPEDEIFTDSFVN